MEPPSKKQRVLQQYREEYTKQWPFIKKSTTTRDSHVVWCEMCCTDIKIGTGGRRDIQRHISTPKHKVREESRRGGLSVSSFFKTSSSDPDLQVTRAEMLFASFLVEHNVPFAVADHATHLFKRMFPDSKTADKFQSGRTKTRTLVGELAQNAREKTVATLRGRPFSLSTDGSNDKGSEQLYPVLVRYHNDVRVVNEVLAVATPKGNSTGREIFNCLDVVLKENDLDWSNCISFGADNASVMVGRFNGVAAFIKEQNADVHVQGCPCHLLHIAAKNATSAMRCDIEERLIDIYYYLENSTKRQKSLQSFQAETGTAIRKIIKHGPTRWLSLINSIQRLLEQWEALSAFFQAEMDAGKAKIKPGDRVSRVNEFLSNKSSRLYAHFLCYSLPSFTKANLLFQKDEPVLHLLQERLHDVAIDLLIGFIKPAVIASSDDIYSIKVEKRSMQKDREDLQIGEQARSILEAEKGKGLSNTAITTFFEDVRAFYSTATKYMFSKLPMQTEELKMAAVLDIKKRQKMKFSAIRFWLARFQCLRKDADVEELERQFSRYQIDQLEDVDLTQRIDVVWSELSGKYPALAKIMKGLLAIPHSNAESERVFSIVRKNKTEQRASMSRNLLSDILTQKMDILGGGKACHQINFDRKVLLRGKKC